MTKRRAKTKVYRTKNRTGLLCQFNQHIKCITNKITSFSVVENAEKLKDKRRVGISVFNNSRNKDREERRSMSVSAWRHAVFWPFCILVVFVNIPFCFLGWRQVYVRRNDACIAVRYLRYLWTVLAGVILQQIYFIRRVWFLCLIANKEDKMKSKVTLADNIAIGLYYFCTPLVWYSVLFRLWHLSYDLHWHILSSDGQWIRHINTERLEENGWINHKRTFGNHQWTFKHLFVPFMFGCYLMVSGAFMVMGKDGSDIVVNVLAVGCIVAIIAVWRGIPDPAMSTETLLLFTEQRRLIWLGAFGFVVGIIQHVVGGAISFSHRFWFSSVCVEQIVYIYIYTYSINDEYQALL